jgi:hypothetical protein
MDKIFIRIIKGYSKFHELFRILFRNFNLAYYHVIVMMLQLMYLYMFIHGIEKKYNLTFC